MSKVIKLYDIPSKAPGSAWSPNTWKTRYTLNYKGLAFETVWVEYPDIKDAVKNLGAAPTIDPDGIEIYTLPMIHDLSTGAVIVDSNAITEYLDATYPDTPRVIPDGTRGLQLAFRSAAVIHLGGALWQFTIPAVHTILNPRSAEYFRRTRESELGMTLEEILPPGEKREKEWKKIEVGLGKIDKWYPKDCPFITGSSVSPIFTDIWLAGLLMWVKKGCGEDSDEWRDIASWNGGRWAHLLKCLEKYE